MRVIGGDKIDADNWAYYLEWVAAGVPDGPGAARARALLLRATCEVMPPGWTPPPERQGRDADGVALCRATPENLDAVACLIRGEQMELPAEEMARLMLPAEPGGYLPAAALLNEPEVPA